MEVEMEVTSADVIAKKVVEDIQPSKLLVWHVILVNNVQQPLM